MLLTNKQNKPDVTLVLPCYNEEQHLNSSIKTIVSVLSCSRYHYEIILIDDRSTDNTAQILKKVKRLFPDLNIQFHSQNQGRGATVMDGIRSARAGVVGFIDVDLEVSADYIPHLVEIIMSGEADIAIGHRFYPFTILPFNNLARVISSKSYSWLIKHVLKLPTNDTESGYKFFNRSKILEILPLIKDKHWFWDTEIISRSFQMGLRIKEVPVLFLRNPAKTSTVKLFSDTIKYINALYRFKKSLPSN